MVVKINSAFPNRLLGIDMEWWVFVWDGVGREAVLGEIVRLF
jgi:hypothetical protein